MTETVKDIDDVAPAGDGNRLDFTDKAELAGVVLRLTDFRGPFDSKMGPFHVFSAVRLDTGEEIAFSGGSVLDQQGQKCREGHHFPVNAVLVKRPGQSNAYWCFESPESQA